MLKKLQHDGVACAVGSGQAASAMCIQNLAQAGDNIVASTDLYGGTVNLFENTLDNRVLKLDLQILQIKKL